MKELRYFYSIGLVFFAFSTINGQLFQSVEDLGMKGSVKKVIEKEYKAEEKMGEVEAVELISKATFSFYENGKIKNEFFGKWYPIQNNYNKNGQLVSTYLEFSDNGDVLKMDSIFYNSNNLIEKKMIINLEKNGSDSKFEKYETKKCYQYKYSSNNDLVAIDYMDEYNSIDNPPCYSCKEIHQSNLGSKRDYLNAKLEEVIDNNWEKGHVEFKYEYDQRNNWIKCIYIVGSPFKIITREITYY
jgi:hypothetical protein